MELALILLQVIVNLFTHLALLLCMTMFLGFCIGILKDDKIIRHITHVYYEDF